MDSIITYSLKAERVKIVRLLSKSKNLLLCKICTPTVADSVKELRKFIEK